MVDTPVDLEEEPTILPEENQDMETKEKTIQETTKNEADAKKESGGD